MRTLENIIAQLERDLADVANVVCVMESIGNEADVAYYEGKRRMLEDVIATLEKEDEYEEIQRDWEVAHPDEENLLFSKN
jgi:hypothetical protein